VLLCSGHTGCACSGMAARHCRAPRRRPEKAISLSKVCSNETSLCSSTRCSSLTVEEAASEAEVVEAVAEEAEVELAEEDNEEDPTALLLLLESMRRLVRRASSWRYVLPVLALPVVVAGATAAAAEAAAEAVAVSTVVGGGLRLASGRHFSSKISRNEKDKPRTPTGVDVVDNGDGDGDDGEGEDEKLAGFATGIEGVAEVVEFSRERECECEEGLWSSQHVHWMQYCEQNGASATASTTAEEVEEAAAD
jgi:hypothetical protein